MGPMWLIPIVKRMSLWRPKPAALPKPESRRQAPNFVMGTPPPLEETQTKFSDFISFCQNELPYEVYLDMIDLFSRDFPTINHNMPFNLLSKYQREDLIETVAKELRKVFGGTIAAAYARLAQAGFRKQPEPTAPRSQPIG